NVATIHARIVSCASDGRNSAACRVARRHREEKRQHWPNTHRSQSLLALTSVPSATLLPRVRHKLLGACQGDANDFLSLCRPYRGSSRTEGTERPPARVKPNVSH